MAINELMRSILFDPQEIYEELLCLDFTDIPKRELMEVLYALKECCMNSVVSRMPDVTGKLCDNNEAFRQNKADYRSMMTFYHSLVSRHSVDPRLEAEILALLDLSLRIDLMELKPEEQTRFYRQNLVMRRER